MAEETKQQATFTKINQLRPDAFGLNLTVKVADSKAIQTRGGRNGTQGCNMPLAECLVGDETEVVVFTARNEQGEDQCITTWRYLRSMTAPMIHPNTLSCGKSDLESNSPGSKVAANMLLSDDV
ncbi:putative nucleic acid-binding, OB-fold protein [Tanacetum coccineum]